LRRFSKANQEMEEHPGLLFEDAPVMPP
jgi:hypothetical protein